jgi:hypothetical protein
MKYTAFLMNILGNLGIMSVLAWHFHFCGRFVPGTLRLKTKKLRQTMPEIRIYSLLSKHSVVCLSATAKNGRTTLRPQVTLSLPFRVSKELLFN